MQLVYDFMRAFPSFMNKSFLSYNGAVCDVYYGLGHMNDDILLIVVNFHLL